MLLTRHRPRLLQLSLFSKSLTEVVSGDCPALGLLIGDDHVEARAQQERVHRVKTHALQLDHFHLRAKELLLRAHLTLHPCEALRLLATDKEVREGDGTRNGRKSTC